MTPRVAMVDLPRGIAHCRPAADCRCHATCARAERARCDCSWVIDASVAMRVLGDCPMFIDKRGAELHGGLQ